MSFPLCHDFALALQLRADPRSRAASEDVLSTARRSAPSKLGDDDRTASTERADCDQTSTTADSKHGARFPLPLGRFSSPGACHARRADNATPGDSAPSATVEGYYVDGREFENGDVWLPKLEIGAKVRAQVSQGNE